MPKYLRPLSPEEYDRPFGQHPPTARAEHTKLVNSCKIDITTQDIAELRSLVQNARLGPATYENSSRSDINTEFGMTRSWMSEAIDAWVSDSRFDW